MESLWSVFISAARCCFACSEHRGKETRRQVELSNPVLSSTPTPGPLQLICHRQKALALQKASHPAQSGPETCLLTMILQESLIMISLFDLLHVCNVTWRE